MRLIPVLYHQCLNLLDVLPSYAEKLYRTTMPHMQILAKKLNAAYIVDGNVDRLEFDGNTVMHDKYVMFLTVKLIPTSAADAAPLWKITNKKFYKKIKATRGRSIVTVFTEEQIPEVASTLSEDIAQALGR